MGPMHLDGRGLVAQCHAQVTVLIPPAVKHPGAGAMFFDMLKEMADHPSVLQQSHTSTFASPSTSTTHRTCSS